jgi:hypothetical protein
MLQVLVGKREGRRLLGKLGVDGRTILQRVPKVKVKNSPMLRTFRLPKIPHSAWVAVHIRPSRSGY